MSVLSRHRTIPSQRTSGEPVALEPASTRRSGKASTTGPSRTAFLVSVGALITAAAVGATALVVAQDDPVSSPRTVDRPFDSEVHRDAAAAARGGTAADVATSEAQRDAAAAARHASR